MGKTVVINVKSQISKTFKKKSTSFRSQMKKRKGKKSKSNSTSGNGKIFGFKVPILSDILKNHTAQKLFIGAGAVTVLLSGARIVNNQRINNTLNKRGVKPLIALASGDIVSGAYQLVVDEGLIDRAIRNGGNNMNVGLNEAGFA